MILKKLNKFNLSIEDLPELKLKVKDIDKIDRYANYLTNKTLRGEHFDLPMMESFVDDYPDYAVLGNEHYKFNYTNDTIVTWFIKDEEFDEIDGLYEAIVRKDELSLRFYKWYLKDVKYFAPQDFSINCKDAEYTVIDQLKKVAITFLWFVFEMDGIVFPLAKWGNEESFEYCFSNIERGSNVIISLKGSMLEKIEQEHTAKAVKALTDIVMPKAILVYNTCSDEKALEFLKYPISKGVKIILLPNTLKTRNTRGKCNGK